MVDLGALELLVVDEFVEFVDEASGLGDVEGSEVAEEGVVLEVFVDAEVEGALDAFGGCGVGHPVQLVLNDLNYLPKVLVHF